MVCCPRIDEGVARVSQDEEDTRRQGEPDDPLEERTEPLPARSDRPARSPRAENPVADPEATIFSRGLAPPVLIDEPGNTVHPRDELDSAPVPGLDPAAEGEEAPTVVLRDAALSSEEGGMADLPTVVSSGTDESMRQAGLAPSSSLQPMLLERVDPSMGRGERVSLDATHWRVSLGRGENNNVRLYTASASRDHAVISGNEAGEWVLTPNPGRAVAVDGEPTSDPVVLEEGMNILLGADHLRCVVERLDRPRMAAATALDGFQDQPMKATGRKASSSLSWWLIGTVALVGIGLIAYAWFLG
jgi:hypothetical protein